jgi:hypothetical protein
MAESFQNVDVSVISGDPKRNGELERYSALCGCWLVVDRPLSQPGVVAIEFLLRVITGSARKPDVSPFEQLTFQFAVNLYRLQNSCLNALRRGLEKSREQSLTICPFAASLS